MIRETRAGLRRYAGTERADQFAWQLGHYGEGDSNPPNTAQRTLGDYIHPARTGSPTGLVNAVSRSIGGDAAEWRFERIVGFVAGLERSRADQ